MQKRFFGGLYMLVFLFLFSVDVQAKDVSVLTYVLSLIFLLKFFIVA